MIYSLLIMLLVGIFVGILGSILGIGGGMIITPILTIGFGLDIKYAIGASIIAVIATSSGSTIAYLKDNILNLRVAMFLEIATTTGAIAGALLTGLFNPVFLYVLFGLLLFYSGFNMIKKLKKQKDEISDKDDKLAEKLKLNSSYYDKNSNQTINYKIQNVPGGASMMFGAGLASGLLGIGSGSFKVIAMDSIMKMPLKPSSSTSNLMMGVTASASATIYFFNGSILPEVAIPMALGIIFGSAIGARLMQKMTPRLIRIIFIPIIIYLGLQMILKGFGVNLLS
ncbi:TSUP family transporter [Lactobacillus sp. S2-2]|uniref:sulfite exporter TauE/SafE family protein n=1 Tax=Lactobacillus sp. S2-2 TaxID=2692917 RepID=UPI001F3CD465|nr:sulfite exporter TauE/SafE family protein [Lactobacillus sp. S2-2]MCF6514749.1 TSUP family transporter [Lactobacillus sp. S2-2]